MTTDPPNCEYLQIKKLTDFTKMSFSQIFLSEMWLKAGKPHGTVQSYQAQL